MLSVSALSKHFGARRVLDGVSFVLEVGDRAGLIGPTGSGKTTLLAIIAGELAPDAGAVEPRYGARLGYLRQGYRDVAGLPVRATFPHLFAALAGDEELAHLSEQLAVERRPQEAAALARAYEAALARMETAASPAD